MKILQEAKRCPKRPSENGTFLGERQSIAQKGVRAIDARNSWLENGSDASEPVFVLPGCQRTNVNTLLCDTLGLADFLGIF